MAAHIGAAETKNERKNLSWARYRPIGSCAMVPRKTSTSARARHTTVRRREVNETNHGYLTVLHELGEGILLLLDELFIAHQLVEPRLLCLGHNRGQQVRLLPGLRIGAGDFRQHGFGARQVERLAPAW